MDIAEKILRLKDDFDDVYDAGKKTEYDAFWDAFQENGKRLHYAYAFAFNGWFGDTNYNPKYPMIVDNTNGIGNMYTWSRNITDTKVPISISNGSMAQAFNQSLIERIHSLEVHGVTSYSNAFQNCTKLKELNLSGVIDINGFDIHWSTSLTADSLKSIIEALSTSTTGLTITLPSTAQANYEAVYGSGSWSTLVAARSNWTIAYA